MEGVIDSQGVSAGIKTGDAGRGIDAACGGVACGIDVVGAGDGNVDGAEIVSSR